MTTAGLLIGLATMGQAAPISGRSAADAVTLRDGKVILGQVVDSDRRGPLLILVRRAWAEANLPDRASAWAKAEAPATRRAEAARLDRLRAWRRDRPAGLADGDRITPWLDRELARLAGRDPLERSTLILARIARGEVRAVDRRPSRDGRMLRLGWLIKFPDVEAMATDDLARGIEGRGFAPEGDSPVAVDALLPAQPETDARWLIRRASTEVVNDPGGRLIRYQGLILPEPAPGEAPPVASGLDAAVGALKDLLGEAPVDPLPGRLRELGARGRVGAVVTRMEMAGDFSEVAVEATLWARAGDRWDPSIVRSSRVRPDDLPADAGNGLADDPQVKAAFGVVESLGLGRVSPELQRRSLVVGAATRKALGQARAALDRELDAAALPLTLESDRVRDPSAGPAPRP